MTVLADHPAWPPGRGGRGSSFALPTPWAGLPTQPGRGRGPADAPRFRPSGPTT